MDQDPRTETLDQGLSCQNPGPETQDSGLGPQDLESSIKEFFETTQKYLLFSKFCYLENKKACLLGITKRCNKEITNRGRFQGLQIGSRGITNRGSLRDFKSGQRDYKLGLGFQIVQGFNPSLLRLQLTFLALFSTNKLPLFLLF